jgi:hypothetical protein
MPCGKEYAFGTPNAPIHPKRKVAMAVFIATNTIKSAKTQLAVNQAVSEAIGEREEAWRVSITESPDKKVWYVTVKGPNGFRWKQQFEGKECNPVHVGSAIRATLEKSEEELARALSELVKEGVMFTREVRPDGEVEYVIDRIRLSGEDVKYLRSRGALTRRGIQHYLVGRR